MEEREKESTWNAFRVFDSPQKRGDDQTDRREVHVVNTIHWNISI